MSRVRRSRACAGRRPNRRTERLRRVSGGGRVICGRPRAAGCGGELTRRTTPRSTAEIDGEGWLSAPGLPRAGDEARTRPWALRAPEDGQVAARVARYTSLTRQAGDRSSAPSSKQAPQQGSTRQASPARRAVRPARLVARGLSAGGVPAKGETPLLPLWVSGGRQGCSPCDLGGEVPSIPPIYRFARLPAPAMGMGASGPTLFPSQSPAALRFTRNGASGEAGAPAETRQLRACPASGPLIRPRVTATAVGRVGSAPGR